MMTGAGRKKLDKLRQELGQLELPLEPWGGRSPRCLTRAYEKFTLEAQDDDVTAFSLEESDRLDQMCRRHFHGS